MVSSMSPPNALCPYRWVLPNPRHLSRQDLRDMLARMVRRCSFTLGFSQLTPRLLSTLET